MSKGSVPRRRPFVPPEAPKTRKAGATRLRLLRVGADLFVEQGYEAVSMRDIAEKAGLTHGGIYGHYRSKGQLLVEVIRWLYDEWVTSAEFGDAVADPDRAIGLVADDSGRNIRLLEVDAAAAARHDPDVAAGMAALYADRQEAVRAAVSGVVADPDTVAWIIAVVEAGVGMKEALGAEPPSPDRFLPMLRSVLMSLTVCDPRAGGADE